MWVSEKYVNTGTYSVQDNFPFSGKVQIAQGTKYNLISQSYLQLTQAQLWNQWQMTLNIPLYLHLNTKFRPNCSGVIMYPVHKITDHAM
jgi:hypothetical protein